MQRIAIWLANGGLFVLCCYLVAATLNQIGAEILIPEAAPARAAEGPPPRPARSWQDRQVILDRNLFQSATFQPDLVAAPVVEEEDLEATKLPLKLLGTAASNVPALSWAAVQDLQKREHNVVRINDEVAADARVVGIDRRRIVIENRGRREELALDESPTGSATSPRRPPSTVSRTTRPSAPSSPRPNVRAATTPGTHGGAGMARNAAALFSQARFLPKYEEGQMVGVQLTAVKPDSIFEKAGIENGDTIVTFNGIAIDSPRQSAELLREFGEAEAFEIVVRGADGGERTLNYEVDE